jgi:hypothetical protein
MPRAFLVLSVDGSVLHQVPFLLARMVEQQSAMDAGKPNQGRSALASATLKMFELMRMAYLNKLTSMSLDTVSAGTLVLEQ